jgi:sec-independent protein translocase protein TatC
VSEDGGESLVAPRLEVRNRLLKAVLALVIAFVGLLPFANDLYTAVSEPLRAKLPAGSALIATQITSGFFAPMRLAFYSAIALAAPVILYQLWAFVAPGLYDKEKKLARPLLVAATGLFYAGCAFTAFVILPVMFAWFIAATPTGVVNMPDINEYLNFIMVMLLAGGVSFEVPIAVLIAVILGWVTPKQLAEWRGYVVVAIFIIAAIITPPDGLSQVMLAVPMCLLYEAGIVMARLLRQRADAAGPQAP